ncbi:MAG: outer membrane beta-barrel protein [Bacteroidales bacterium]|nr:outer membrane beta-barrel protein [Bacteroidales bacterium]
MKRLIFLLLLNSILANSFGQLYIQPSVGYTFSSHPTENQSSLIIDNLKSVYKTELKFGEGIHFGFNLGYCFMDKILIELNIKKTIYAQYCVSTEQPDLQSLNNFSLSGYFGEINNESSVFQIAPLIGYQVQKNRFNSYFKFGPNFMKSTINQTLKYIDWELDNWDFYPLNTIKKYEYTGKFHKGLQANLGFCYSLNQNLQLVLDFVTVYNNYEITKTEIKFYEIDGVSHLYELENTNIEIDSDDNKLNHSHYGIIIGIRYEFDRNK